jgi:hypothetical protein
VRIYAFFLRTLGFFGVYSISVSIPKTRERFKKWKKLQQQTATANFTTRKKERENH